jgi:hypothetical protein
MPVDDSRQLFLARSAGRPHGGQDAPAGGMELFVGGAARSQLELGNAIACEARVRVAVDEARHRGAATRVELHDVGWELVGAKLRHGADRGNPPTVAEDVGALDDPNVAQRSSPQGCRSSRR